MSRSESGLYIYFNPNYKWWVIVTYEIVFLVSMFYKIFVFFPFTIHLPSNISVTFQNCKWKNRINYKITMLMSNKVMILILKILSINKKLKCQYLIYDTTPPFGINILTSVLIWWFFVHYLERYSLRYLLLVTYFIWRYCIMINDFIVTLFL